MMKEEKNYRDYPEISPFSEQIVNESGNYIPIFKRAIELQNMKKLRIIMNEKKKNKEIDDMIKKSNSSSYYVDKDEINEFYMTQINWKNKIKKRNTSLLIQKNEEMMKEEKKLLSYKIKINEKSKKIVEKKFKQYLTINNSPTNKKKRNKNIKRINTFERLYNESELREKKMNMRIKSYFNQLFKPNIKHSYSFTRVPKAKLNQKKNYNNIHLKKEHNYTTSHNKNIINLKKMNNISKNMNNIPKKMKHKKSYSIITYETVNIQKKNENKNISRNKKSPINNIESSKSTKGTYNNIKNMNTIGLESLSTKIYSSPVKDIHPLPIKLGEIKEMDSVIFESTGRNKNQEDLKSIIHKNTYKNNEENINNIDKLPIQKKTSLNTFFNNNEIKEEERESEKNESNKLLNNKSKKNSKNNSKKNSKNNSKNNLSKKSSKAKLNLKNTQKNSVKNSIDKSYSKEDKNKKSKLNKNKNTNKNTTNKNTNKNINKNINTNKSISNKLNSYMSNEESYDILNNKNEDDNYLIKNSLLNDSGMFGNYQPSNILENISGQR